MKMVSIMKFDNVLIHKQISLTTRDFKYKTECFEAKISSKTFDKDDIDIFIIELLNYYLIFSCFQELKSFTTIDFTEILADINSKIIQLKKYV